VVSRIADAGPPAAERGDTVARPVVHDLEAGPGAVAFDITGVVELEVLAEHRTGTLDDIGGVVQAAQAVDHLQLHRVAAFQLHARGGLADHAQEAAYRAGTIAHGGIGEREPAAVGLAGAPDRQRQVFAVGGMAAQGAFGQRLDGRPLIGPDLEQRRAQRGRMPAVQQGDIGRVVQHDEARPPCNIHRKFGFQDQADRIPQGRIPMVGLAERRARPVMQVVPGAHGAGGVEEMKVARSRFHADRLRVRKWSFYAQMH
jgi:hypothetical protein